MMKKDASYIKIRRLCLAPTCYKLQVQETCSRRRHLKSGPAKPRSTAGGASASGGQWRSVSVVRPGT